jgi:hypothetical protein
MKTKVMLGVCVLAIAILAYGTLGSGAWWAIPTTTTGSVEAATFDVDSDIDTASGTCDFSNLAPGDDPVVCKIKIINNSTIPINVLWSGFSLSQTNGLANHIIVIEFADDNNETSLSDIASYAGTDGVMTLAEIAVPLANGYFSDPDGVNGYGSIFVDENDDGWVSLTLQFDDDAPNTTIGGTANFTWTLTAQQRPKNSPVP